MRINKKIGNKKVLHIDQKYGWYMDPKQDFTQKFVFGAFRLSMTAG